LASADPRELVAGEHVKDAAAADGGLADDAAGGGVGDRADDGRGLAHAETAPPARRRRSGLRWRHAANEKIVSLFEPHADIIVKGGRDVQYGHKLNLTTSRSGLILDLVIEAGNPADSERFLPMLKRHIAFYGEAPRQTAADGGFATRDNLSEAKALGVRDVAFHKKAGLRIMDMVKSNWVYRKLRNFRAGIESDISCLKRAYGLARCLWRGLDHFTAYVWSSVVAYNLALFARLRPI
jgi:transposase, IS5 family